MNIYYEVQNVNEDKIYKNASKNIKFYLNELFDYNFDKTFLEYRYTAFTLFNIKDINEHYLNTSDWKSGKKHLWSKSFVLYENDDEIDFWIAFLKNEVEKCRISSYNTLEFLAKIKVFTSYFLETEKCGYECFSLDAEYGLLFDNKSELNFQFLINSWEFKVDTQDKFKIFVNCQFLIDDAKFGKHKIDFVILVISFEKLVEEYKKNKFSPLVYIMSTTFEKDLLSKYIEHTFSSFKASSIEELNYKIATFAHDFKFDTIKKNHNRINFKLEKRIN
ncbi:hypothetical protein [Flavobacterium sp.]|uniref:hypothetical protein n=1 Tax=Flavobacterium sp. TaxID=239 RepID=UPI00404751C8